MLTTARRLMTLAALGVAVTLCTLAVLTGTAGAEVVATATAVQLDQTVTLDATLFAILAGTVTPIVVGLITKLNATSGLKAIVTLFLTAVVAVFNDVVIAGNGTFNLKTAIVFFAVTFVTHVATYAGLYKPTTGAAPGAQATAQWGLGRS